MIGRRFLLGCALASLATAVPARAQTGVQAGGPEAPITALCNGLLAIMHAGRATPFARRAAMLGPVVEQAFSLDVVLRTSVGPRYAAMSVADRAALLAAFTDFTVANYVANFAEFKGERFVVSPQARAVGENQVVHSQIVPASGDPTTLDYVMRQGEDGWRAVDVLLDGSISRVAVQRSDFRSLLSGGTTAPLIASLRKRSAALSEHG